MIPILHGGMVEYWMVAWIEESEFGFRSSSLYSLMCWYPWEGYESISSPLSYE